MPLTGSSGMPSAGQNMRDSVKHDVIRRREREDEVTRRAELRGERSETPRIRLERLQLIRRAHAHHQARAARARNANGAAQIEIVRRERERIEHREAFAIVQLAPDRRSRLADGDAPIVTGPAHVDVHDAGLRFLAQPFDVRAPARTARSAPRPSRDRRSPLPREA